MFAYVHMVAFSAFNLVNSFHCLKDCCFSPLSLAGVFSSSRLVTLGLGFCPEGDGRARHNDGGLSVAVVPGPKDQLARSLAAALQRSDPQEEPIVKIPQQVWGSLSEPVCGPSVDRAVGVFLSREAHIRS